MPQCRRGITLIEMLVVIAIIAVLIAVIVPAIQYAREAGRRTQCQNQLRQLALAAQTHASTHEELPALYNGQFLQRPRTPLDEFHFHSWRTELLTQLENASLHERLRRDLPATAIENEPVFSVSLPAMLCPSTSTLNQRVPEILGYNNGAVPTAIIGVAGRSDYEAIAGVRFPPMGGSDFANVRFGAWGEPTYDMRTHTTIRTRVARLRDVIDGLSNTMLIGERAGRPDDHRRGQPVAPYPYADPNRGMDHHQAAWAISTHIAWLLLPHNQPINVANASGVFAFHPGGANVATADGAVRFLAESTDVVLLQALATRAHGDGAGLE